MSPAAACLLLAALLACAGIPEAARITVRPETISVLDNTPAVFVCRAEGSPAPSVEWRIDDSQLAREKSSIFSITIPFGKVLRIDPARMLVDNNTKISCVVNSAELQAPVVADARLFVYSGASASPAGFPRFERGPSTKVVEKGSQVELECQASGDPQPTVFWLKDYVPIDFSSERFRLSQDGSLVIEQAEPEYEGRYACVARNRHGSVESKDAQLYVRVRSTVPRFVFRPTSIEVQLGASANLTCAAVGEPTPNVSWYDSRGVLRSPLAKGNCSLRLSDIVEDENFTCAAENVLGRITWMVQVKVQKTPEPPTGLQAVEFTANSVTIEFRKSATDDVRSYTVSYMRRGDSSWIQVENVGAGAAGDTVQATISGLQPHTTYRLRVDSVTDRASSQGNAASRPIEFVTREAGLPRALHNEPGRWAGRIPIGASPRRQHEDKHQQP